MRLGFVIVFTFLAWVSSAPCEEPRKLVVISIDGLDSRYLRDADKLHLKIPTLRRLVKQGSVADVVGMIPNDSWAANTTIVTGQPPAAHGVLGDGAATQTSKVPALWQKAKEAHRTVAMLYWPATVGAPVDWNCPQFWEGNRAVDLPFDPIAAKCTPGFVQTVALSYPSFRKAQWNDETALDGLRYLLQVNKPDLTLVHLDDLEGEERETGALSVYSRDVLENDDDMLGQALAKLSPHSVVAIVSDHGFDTERFVLRPKVLANSQAIQVRHGLIGAMDQKTAAALRKLIGAKKSGIAREAPLPEVKRLIPEASVWVAAFETALGYVASESAKGPAVSTGNHKGVSDLWPNRQDFRGVFILSGEGIQPARSKEISIQQIEPTLAGILGLPSEPKTDRHPKPLPARSRRPSSAHTSGKLD